jgi:hypothetical protein
LISEAGQAWSYALMEDAKSVGNPAKSLRFRGCGVVDPPAVPL